MKKTNLSKQIANIISFMPLLKTNIKLNLKENDDKLTDHKLKQLEKEYSMLEIKRKNYIAEKHYETETNIHKTGKLKLLIIYVAMLSICLSLFGTDVFENIFKEETVTEIKSYLTVCLMLGIMFINYYFSSQLGLIKEKFYIMFKPALVVIVCCITVSVFFNFTFLKSILTVENMFLKISICLLKSLLLDVGLTFLLYYENSRKTLSFSYKHMQTETKQNLNRSKQKINNVKHIPNINLNRQTEKQTDKTEANRNQTETQTYINRTQTENKQTNRTQTENKQTNRNQTDKTEMSFDKKMDLIKSMINELDENENIEYKNIKHFIGRYQWDKAKKMLEQENIIYIKDRQCKKSPANNLKVI